MIIHWKPLLPSLSLSLMLVACTSNPIDNYFTKLSDDAEGDLVRSVESIGGGSGEGFDEIDAVEQEEEICHQQQVTQPAAEITNKVDLLIITDTSGSLNAEKVQIASSISEFVRQLPEDADLSIGVTLGHAATQYAGKLYRSPKGEPAVLRNSQMSHSEMTSKVLQKLKNQPGEGLTDGGEAGIYALKLLLEPQNFSAAQSEGFFRSGAGLAVLFISDENDLCTLGLVPDPNGKEVPFYDHFCAGWYTKEVMYQKIVERIGATTPLLLSSWIYTDASTTPQGGENEMGLGFKELVELSGGLLLDMSQANYDQQMAQLGQLTSSTLELVTNLTLEHSPVAPESIEVFVDGDLIDTSSWVYQASVNQVQIHESVLFAQAETRIDYCIGSSEEVE